VAGLVADAGVGVEEWDIVVVVMAWAAVAVRVDAESQLRLVEVALAAEEADHLFAYCFACIEVASVEAAMLMVVVSQLDYHMDKRREEDTAAAC